MDKSSLLAQVQALERVTERESLAKEEARVAYEAARAIRAQAIRVTYVDARTVSRAILKVLADGEKHPARDIKQAATPASTFYRAIDLLIAERKIVVLGTHRPFLYRIAPATE